MDKLVRQIEVPMAKNIIKKAGDFKDRILIKGKAVVTARYTLKKKPKKLKCRIKKIVWETAYIRPFFDFYR